MPGCPPGRGDGPGVGALLDAPHADHSHGHGRPERECVGPGENEVGRRGTPYSLEAVLHVVEHVLLHVDGVDRAGVPDGLHEPAGKVPGACSHIGDRHAGCELQGIDDLPRLLVFIAFGTVQLRQVCLDVRRAAVMALVLAPCLMRPVPITRMVMAVPPMLNATQRQSKSQQDQPTKDSLPEPRGHSELHLMY